MSKRRAAVVAMMLVVSVRAAVAADWPTHGGNNRRGNTTNQRLELPLEETWSHQAKAPRPAWPAPAKQDFWHSKGSLASSITFDRANRVVVAGGSVFFGSSADDKLTCLDAATGRVRWSFFSEGPIRLAPAVADDSVYFGSDDGWAYCLDATDGRLLWKYRPGKGNRRVPGNGRMISQWPLRCGVMLIDGTAYCCAGLFPDYGVYLAAVDARTGQQLWKRTLSGMAPQGYMLASGARLFVPSGRTSPAMFQRSDGRSLGIMQDGQRGGSFALLANDLLVHRGSEEASLGVSDSQSGERIVLFDGLHFVAKGNMAFVHSGRQLAALDRGKFIQLARENNTLAARKREMEERREELQRTADAATIADIDAQIGQRTKQIDQLGPAMDACWVWRRPSAHSCSLVLADNVLFAGGDGVVTAYSIEDGTPLWHGRVTGKAYGLAVAAGSLFVSTDQGTIHCFQ